MLEVGRILDHAVLEIDKALYTARKHDKKHRYAHGFCRCEWQKKVENSKEHADNLEVAVEHFEDLWRAWKRYLRSLERRGDRRVGGLEEWRRREGRGSESEEFDQLHSFYRKDMRVDEMDHLQAKQRTRQAENLHQEYLAGEGRRQDTDWHKHEGKHKKAWSTSDHIQPGSGYGKNDYEYTGRCESGQYRDWHVGSRFRPWRRS
ncbi:predicted protein [Verticillium alfalfae VaMs.102]|uniref:Predicted protein n=1 Tax=Verticillium alfalfae (strain VaMs.102 / ATCC MYA-4576 / FGSC 10136) TaxID=526221 RepID=C9SWS3_VERA1|nr:predicted protein [Verticillium alfalfae VaMs.102]EEY23464.1 predicted protein [Verticillium alfalfae VaMs.102]